MKSLTLIAALAMGTAAVAQDAPAMQSPPADMTSPTPAPVPSTDTPPAAPNDGGMAPTTSAPMDQPMATDTPPPAAPGDSGTAPSQPMASDTGMTPPAAAATDYPVCSRTVTDKCINRSAAPRGKRR